MTLDERLKSLMIDSQDRCKFVENPDEYIKNEIKKYTTQLHKKWFETTKKFQKRLELSDKAYSIEMKKRGKQALIPVYVYYKGDKILVPNSFYSRFDKPDTTTFLEYLDETDRQKNIITDEDREKARLLNCDVNYNYLQTLINKMTNVPDLVITIKHKDNMTVVLRRTDKEEADDTIVNNELIVEPLMVK